MVFIVFSFFFFGKGGRDDEFFPVLKYILLFGKHMKRQLVSLFNFFMDMFCQVC